MTTTTRTTEPKRTEAIRHETRALLRAHLSAASGYRHLTRHCAVCHRLLRLAQEAAGSHQAKTSDEAPDAGPGAAPAAGPARDESPRTG
ncbi:DUF6274 family protein [Streptomyces albireticuli]|uniref:Uncharacterized protein n=1 Tax=Streptomyces albireticuli TaxID=1940 RepID=A0A2A2DDT3_9ACTN|nr:DUF6274 family protein [Streptomyces albireticuli]MCD9143981.1 DUF6274 family protein [Streptomyces albireticuli]MCD9161588.1 DUF6274 family protein [Streptomyces albireticuli]MCD9192098.1 DUF6274 family protein [Streptomyces albireticuli]PAU49607.1 hypothetical protein CK936_07020 [Streptomyces albireticuli]